MEKIEKKNRKFAEIQLINEENEQKILSLQDEKQSLSNELESRKIYLLKLKYKEDNLNLLNESNKRALNDKEEHILKLKNTINRYHKFNDKINPNNNFKNIINMKEFDERINNLKIELDNLITQRQKFLYSNSKLENQLLNINNNNLGNNNEEQLNNELNDIKIENDEKKLALEKKENQLKILKNEIDSLTMDIRNDNNNFDEIHKKQIKNLINENDDKNINDEIKLKSEINLKKNYQIEQAYKNYRKTKMERIK